MKHLNVNLTNLITGKRYDISVESGNGAVDVKGWNGFATDSNQIVSVSGTGIQKIKSEIIPGFIASVFDPSSVVGGVSISNENRTAFGGVHSANAFVFSDQGVSEGTYYFEATKYGYSHGLGLAQKPGTIGAALTGAWKSVWVNNQDGKVTVNNMGTLVQDYVSPWDNGGGWPTVRFGYGLNCENKTVEFFLNGVSQGFIASDIDLTSPLFIVAFFTSDTGNFTIYTDPDDITYAPEGYEIGFGNR